MADCKNSEIRQSAETIPHKKRKEALLLFRETELHKHLACLFQHMDPNALVEVTHGRDEYGKDLVLVREDQFDKTVIAVVVKKGNVKGKTKGKIDEIQSQISQAVNNPARLKSIKSPLKVNKVWVVIAGELSGNAGERLRNEVERNIQFRDVTNFDIQWLVEHFTQYYPQVFFEESVIDWLQQKIHTLETDHLFHAKGKTLSETFVPPQVKPIDVAIDIGKESIEQNVLSIAKALKKRKKPFTGLKPLIEHQKKVILAGDPGTGKSLALAKVAIDMLKQASAMTIRGNQDKQIEIPLFISAKALLNFDTCEELLQNYIGEEEIVGRYKVTTILLDALDEAPLNQQAVLIKKAKTFALEFSCSLVISTRKIDAIKTTPPGFEKYELLPFEFGQAVELFKKFAKDSQMLDALRDGLTRIRSQVIMTPLSLLMLLSVVEEHSEVPASITELYDRYSDTVLGRYDKNKGIEVLFEYVIKERFLASLAFKEFYQKNRLEIPREEFDQFSVDYTEEYRTTDPPNLEYFLGEIKRSGILNCGQTTVMFWHRSFLDYFVAHYIFDNRENFPNIEQLFVDLYFNNVWADAAFFYSGLKKEVSLTLLEKIIEDDRDGDGLESYVTKFMIGRLLQAAWYSPQKTKRFGIERSIQFIPQIRERLLEIIRKTKGTIPEIAADVLLMFLSDFSLKSGFLQQETIECFRDIQQQPLSSDSLHMMVALLWTLQNSLPEDEISEMVNGIIASAKEAQLSFQEESAIFIVLNIIEKTDKATIKSIGRHLRKLQDADEHTFKKIMPKHLSGYRQKKSK